MDDNQQKTWTKSNEIGPIVNDTGNVDSITCHGV